MNLKKAIEEYNRYRGSEAQAKIISVEDNEVIIEIRGSFCETCGYYDWIEDLVYVMEDYNIKSQIKEIKEEYDGAIVKLKYKIENREDKKLI